MNYVEIVNLVFSILGGIIGLLCLHFVIFFIIGLFAKKRFPEAEKKCKYGVVICARNEQKVIGRLIDSLHNCEYPQENIRVFVVAHNCTDSTAQVSREHGATVFEYDNPEERMKGYALRHAFKRIKEEYGIDSFDGYFIMDADNVVQPDYITKMNDAFVANGQEAVITSFRNSKNFNENYMSCMYGMFFLYGCKFEQRGRSVTNCSTRVTGTGYVFSNKLVENGWNYLTLTEDWEFSADVVTSGNKIVFCDDAVFYDEQPTTVKIMVRQRMRWARGHMEVFFSRIGKLIASIFKPEKYATGNNKNIFSKYDLCVNVLPLGFITVTLFLLQVILLAFTPLFGLDVAEAYKSFFINLGRTLAVSFVGIYISELLLFILERKRIGKLSLPRRIISFILYPVFMLLSIIFDAVSMFVKNLQWKPIPHHYDKKPTAHHHHHKKKNKQEPEEPKEEN